MAKPLKCDLCDESATVHLTQIVNNQIHKIDLCESCAEQKGITDPDGYSLADLLVKPGQEAEEPLEVTAGGLVCDECGYTQREFKKTGRLGCESCYATFANLLSSALAGMHKGERHTGKVPARAVERKTYEDRLNSLEGDLQLAIEEEHYEDAARVRDEILDLKKSTKPEESE
jgi:protein arginine kinase activator